MPEKNPGFDFEVRVDPNGEKTCTWVFQMTVPSTDEGRDILFRFAQAMSKQCELQDMMGQQLVEDKSSLPEYKRVFFFNDPQGQFVDSIEKYIQYAANGLMATSPDFIAIDHSKFEERMKADQEERRRKQEDN